MSRRHSTSVRSGWNCPCRPSRTCGGFNKNSDDVFFVAGADRRRAFSSSNLVLVVVVLASFVLTVSVDVTAAAEFAVPGSAAANTSPRTRSSHQQHADRDCRSAVDRFAGLKLAESHAVPHNKIHPNPPLEVCTGAAGGRTSSCCSRTLERHLHQLAVDDARKSIVTSQGYSRLSDVIGGTLLHRAKLLHLLSVISNSTRHLLSSVYHVDDRGSVDGLFAALTRYVSTADVDLRQAVNDFLDRLFAAVVLPHDIASTRAFQCVVTARRTLSPSPFDGFAVHTADDIIRSLGVANSLLESFSLAENVLDWVGTTIHFDHQCSRALMRLRYCSLCDGVSDQAVRPCRSLCANVARGCLSRLAAGDLASRWALFVSNVVDLSVSASGSYDVERILYRLERSIPTEVGRLILVVHEYNHQLTTACGNIAVRHRPSTTLGPVPPSTDDPQQQQQRRLGAQSLMSGIRQSARGLVMAKNFFSRLPEMFCRSETLNVSDGDEQCWNGVSVGRYNHSVPQLDERQQLSNPEMRVSNVSSDAERNISARLDETTKLLHSRRPPRYSYGYVSSDGSGGGGYYPNWYPVDDEDGYQSGSGSGDGDEDGGQLDVHGSTTVSLSKVDGDRRSSSINDFVFKSSTTSSPAYITRSPPANKASVVLVSCRMFLASFILVLLVTPQIQFT